jgi:hypothetical protein
MDDREPIHSSDFPNLSLLPAPQASTVILITVTIAVVCIYSSRYVPDTVLSTFTDMYALDTHNNAIR